MKRKEVIALVLFGIVLAVAATLLIGRGSSGKSKHRQAEIEVVQPIDTNFSQEAKTTLLGQNKQEPVQSFAPVINLQQGLNNTNPFRTGE